MEASQLYTKVPTERINIDSDSICEQFSEMVHDMTCQICCSIVYPDPVCCKECSKMFCKQCIDTWITKGKGCPNRHEYIEAPVNKLAKNLIENILLTCPNSKLGCQEKIKYGNYLRHIDFECEIIKYSCNGCQHTDKKKIMMMHVEMCDQFDGKCGFCSTVLKKRDLGNHTRICDQRTIECGFCEQLFRSVNFNNHEMNCEEKMLTCNYCKMKFKRKFEQDHTKDVCFREFKKNWENDQFNSLKNENFSLKNTVDNLKRENDILIDKVDKYKAEINRQQDVKTTLPRDKQQSSSIQFEEYPTNNRNFSPNPFSGNPLWNKPASCSKTTSSKKI